MSASASLSVVARFRATIAQRLGLWFGDDKFEFLDTLLTQGAETQNLPRETYVRQLEEAPDAAGLALLSSALTVGETYFFRNVEQFEALAAVAVPSGAQDLRLLSAGCATGEEAYSLALTLRERAAAAGWNLDRKSVV